MYALVDFTDYLVVVNNSLSSYNPDCPVQIEMANEKVIELMATQEGKNKLEKYFK